MGHKTCLKSQHKWTAVNELLFFFYCYNSYLDCQNKEKARCCPSNDMFLPNYVISSTKK